MKQYILKHPDGTIYGPVPESKFEEDLKENRLKEGTLVYFIDKVQMIKEKHESYLAPFPPTTAS